jgi:ubiquinone/menaquinone biosynthesis C-methylase UbiE
MNINITDYADKYKQLQIRGTGILSLKNTPLFIEKYVQGKKALDFGCGAGRSTQFLTMLGLEADGIDINEGMLKAATDKLPSSNFYQSIDEEFPIENEIYDLVFSTLVLFEYDSLAKMEKALKEIHRVLKKDGIFLATTGSTDMYSHEWNSIDALKYPENKNLKSGDAAKIYLKNIDLELTDYFWTVDDYKSVFNESGFELLEIDKPLGTNKDGEEWKDETEVSPYITFVLRKK